MVDQQIMGDAADDVIRKAEQEVEEEGAFGTKLPVKFAIQYFYEYSDKVVIVTGNIWEDGLSIVGPFDSREHAEKWLSDSEHSHEAIVPLSTPKIRSYEVPYNPDLENADA